MRFFIVALFLLTSLIAEELKITANEFKADEKTGITNFIGNINVLKGSDELNASRIDVYTDKLHQLKRFEANGDVEFHIVTLEGSIYEGNAGKVIYKPLTKEYHFYHKVHLRQIDEKKEIIGEEVVLKTIEGKAYAKGNQKEPIIMIFKIPDDKKQ